jgi:hypothetical protein
MEPTTTTTSTGPSRPPRRRSNIRLYTFVSKVITPAVLLLGLLVLAVFHFNGVLANTQSIDNIYHGEQAYSDGPMSYTFQELAGTDRPDINYRGFSILTFVDWSSTISIDGHVTNLWDNFHGYDYDRKNTSDTQFFSTTTGTGWQLIEVVKLTSNHSVTVSYSLVARAETIAEPHHVIVTIEHVHQSLYQPTITGNVFTAGVLSHEMASVTSGDTPTPLGTLTDSVSGTWVPAGSIVLDSTARANQNATGATPLLTDSFATTYVIQNPDVNRMTPLGTETISFTPSASPGTPVSGPMPVLTPTPVGQ